MAIKILWVLTSHELTMDGGKSLVDDGATEVVSIDELVVVEGVVDDEVDEAGVDVMIFESTDCTLTMSALGSCSCD
jgi:hypothetical protein